MEEQSDAQAINVGKYPFAGDLDKSIFINNPELASVRNLDDVKRILDKSSAVVSSFQMMKIWSYSRLHEYEGLAVPIITHHE